LHLKQLFVHLEWWFWFILNIVVMFCSDNLRQVFRNRLEFFAAAKVSSSFPPPNLPEIAFAGRVFNFCNSSSYRSSNSSTSWLE
jgi:hypothetical protein